MISQARPWLEVLAELQHAADTVAPNPFVASSGTPSVVYSVRSCWARAGVSGSVLRISSPLLRCAMASRCAERSMARFLACCQ